MSWHVSPCIYPAWDTLCFLDFIDYFLSHIKECFNYNLFQYFLRPFLFLFFFWDPYNLNVGVFNVVSEVSKTVLNSFHSFFLILFCGSYFHYFIFQDTICFSVSVILLLIPCRDFFILFILFFIIVCLLFSSSRSLLNVSCIFSIIFLRFGSSLLSLLWIVFQVDCLFPLHLFGLVGFYLAPSSAVCFCVFSLLNLLHLWSPFHKLQVCSSVNILWF